MSYRKLSCILFLVFLSSVSKAEILRCKASILEDYTRDLRIEIVVPEAQEYSRELALIDKRTGESSLIGKSEFLGAPLPKAIGMVEISVSHGNGEFLSPRRYSLIVMQEVETKGNTLRGVFVGDEYPGSAFPGLILVDYHGEERKITVADTSHAPAAITTYEGHCE